MKPIRFALILFWGATHTLSAQQLRLQYPSPAPRKAPVYAGLGAVSLTSAGLMVAGITKRNEALDQKDIFEANLDPNAPVYASLGLSRDALETAYKSDLRTGNILLYSGVAVLGIGAGILVNRLIWIRRIDKAKSARTGFAPQVPTPEVTTALAPGGASLGLRFSF